MYSIKPYTKKKYITPIIEFEMMEEEGALMEVRASQMPDETEEPSDKDPFAAKSSDFIFNEEPETPTDELSW